MFDKTEAISDSDSKSFNQYRRVDSFKASIYKISAEVRCWSPSKNPLNQRRLLQQNNFGLLKELRYRLQDCSFSAKLLGYSTHDIDGGLILLGKEI